MSNSSAFLVVRERLVFGLLASLPCLLCLWVNFLMLRALRSKAVLVETCRFVLLFQLLLGDTLQMALSHLLFLLAYTEVLLSTPLCLLLVLLVHVAHDFSPLVLVLMSLERFVAVRLPLRHSAIATATNTAAASLAIWALSAFNNLVRLGIVLQSSAPVAITAQMAGSCNSMVLYPGHQSRVFDEVVTYSLFLAAFLSIAGSYAAVIRTARSASTDQVLAVKARTTLLLHLLQLCLMIASTFHDVLMVALFSVTPRRVFARIQAAFYIALIILPKCLSALVYGLRDSTIRAALILQLCCYRDK